MWSRRDTRRHQYELWDPEFVRANAAKSYRAGVPWEGFPHVYFAPSMLLHVDFHLQPMVGSARGGGRMTTRVQLRIKDADACVAAVTDR